jgi:ferritin
MRLSEFNRYKEIAMLTAKIEKLLNEQVVREAFSSQYYLAIASWCEKAKLPGCAHFFYSHADEERDHMLKFVKYLGAQGAQAVALGIETPPVKFKSLAEIFDKVLEHEKMITRQIHGLVDLCLETKDYGTFHFLQWFVGEQQEEEQLVQSLVDRLAMAGSDPRGLYLFDKSLGKMKES